MSTFSRHAATKPVTKAVNWGVVVGFWFFDILGLPWLIGCHWVTWQRNDRVSSIANEGIGWHGRHVTRGRPMTKQCWALCGWNASSLANAAAFNQLQYITEMNEYCCILSLCGVVSGPWVIDWMMSPPPPLLLLFLFLFVSLSLFISVFICFSLSFSHCSSFADWNAEAGQTQSPAGRHPVKEGHRLHPSPGDVADLIYSRRSAASVANCCHYLLLEMNDKYIRCVTCILRLRFSFNTTSKITFRLLLTAT